MGLVFPGQQDVANTPLGEGHRGTACARVEYRDVGKELADELPGLGVIAARCLQRIAICRQIPPTGTARGFRVGGDHRDAGLDQIVPVLDALGVAFSDQKDVGRGVGRAVMRQALLPVGRNQLRFFGQFVHVVGQGERHDIGFEAPIKTPSAHAAGARRRRAREKWLID